MKNFKLTTSVLFVSICLGVFLIAPFRADALLGVGGYDTQNDYDTCDCTGAVDTTAEPLYLSSQVPTYGTISWYEGTFIYDNGDPAEETWFLASYIPLLPVCWEISGDYCTYEYTWGLMYDGGTSPQNS